MLNRRRIIHRRRDIPAGQVFQRNASREAPAGSEFRAIFADPEAIVRKAFVAVASRVIERGVVEILQAKIWRGHRLWFGVGGRMVGAAGCQVSGNKFLLPVKKKYLTGRVSQ